MTMQFKLPWVSIWLDHLSDVLAPVTEYCQGKAASAIEVAATKKIAKCRMLVAIHLFYPVAVNTPRTIVGKHSALHYRDVKVDGADYSDQEDEAQISQKPGFFGNWDILANLKPGFETPQNGFWTTYCSCILYTIKPIISFVCSFAYCCNS
jgi:hypothetical protein